MSDSETLTLDQIGVPQELRDRAKILWILTVLGGPWGWVVCKFVWKLPGQEDDAWFQRQLKQSLFVGVIGFVGYALCGLGWFIHVGLGALGFMAINKGEDYSAPMIAGFVDGKGDDAQPSGGGAGEPRPQAADPITQESSVDPLEPIEGVAYQTWAWAWGHISQGHPVDDIIGRVQLERSRWDRVHPVFLQRMTQDRSGAIAAELRKYGGTPAPAQQQAAPRQQAAPQQQQPAPQQQAAPQQQPAPQQQAALQQQAAPRQQAAPQRQAAPQAQAPTGAQAVPIERWVEVTVALEVGQRKGWDSSQLLANFGMSTHDWAAADAWWTQQFRVSIHDKALQARYAQLQEYYTSYYSNR